jgi:hypothetical protein
MKLTWADGYRKGWTASYRADTTDFLDDAQERATARFRTRRHRNEHGQPLEMPDQSVIDAFITGWNDQAVGNDYDTNLH